ncbi:hypothetical protein ACFQ3Z_02090 [Streptomyces nogalater]
MAPETSFGALRFADGTMCRLTIGWAAPADKSLLVVGDRESCPSTTCGRRRVRSRCGAGCSRPAGTPVTWPSPSSPFVLPRWNTDTTTRRTT